MLNCGCTETKLCERHDPMRNTTFRKALLKAEAEDNQLRATGGLPSGTMYYISICEPAGCSCHINAPCSYCTREIEDPDTTAAPAMEDGDA